MAEDREKFDLKAWAISNSLTQLVLEKLTADDILKYEDIIQLTDDDINSFNLTNLMTKRLKSAVRRLCQDKNSESAAKTPVVCQETSGQPSRGDGGRTITTNVASGSQAYTELKGHSDLVGATGGSGLSFPTDLSSLESQAATTRPEVDRRTTHPKRQAPSLDLREDHAWQEREETREPNRSDTDRQSHGSIHRLSSIQPPNPHLESPHVSPYSGQQHDQQTHSRTRTGDTTYRERSSVRPKSSTIPKTRGGTPSKHTPSRPASTVGVTRPRVGSRTSIVPNLDEDFTRMTREMKLSLPSTVYRLPKILSLGEGFHSSIPLLEQLPKVVIKEILRFNSRGRDDPCMKCIHRSTLESNTDSGGLTKLQAARKRTKPVGPHPQDVSLLSFKAADITLRQAFCSKCFMCKLAIPFLPPDLPNLPGEISHLALESIVLEWKQTDCVDAIEKSARNAECHVISICRFSTHKVFSKSKLLNSLISRVGHPTYYNRHCDLGDSPRKLADGIIEMSWYLPSRHSSDKFHNPTIFFNLRGDMSSYPDRFSLLDQISDVIVISVNLDDLSAPRFKSAISNISKVKSIIFLVNSGPECPKAKQLQDDDRMEWICTFKEDDIPVNDQELIKELREKILIAVEKRQKRSLKDLIQKAKRFGLSTDDTGREHIINAVEAVCSSLNKDVAVCKRMNLPLQIPMEKKRNLERKRLNSDDKDPTEGERIAQEIAEIEDNQKTLAKEYKSRALMGKFILAVHSIAFPEEISRSSSHDMMLFMRCLSLRLDEISRNCLPALHRKYNQIWDKYNQAKKKQHEHHDFNSIKQELSNASTTLTEHSLGIEHILREVGQMYASIQQHDSNISQDCDEILRKTITGFPDVIAKLMLSGFPLELMDGDSSSIQMPWIRAVFNSLQQLLKNRKIFVLSVLGVQSSGKSTLINAMCGSQFAVGAGRCTKGVFAQLVPLDKQTNGRLPFDYILVIDTEGLRATEIEKGKYEHDNELATFVIGLADVTIMNIQGENYSDIKDVIQIAVHAFLRMKIVSKKRHCNKKCVFVHQNVPAINATEKMKVQSQRLQESLDLAAREAAKIENYGDYINSFNDILEYNWQDSVYYFSDLWLGDLPMAPANCGYSDKVLTVKEDILQMFAGTQSRKKFLSIGDVLVRIEDLWDGIQLDNFVFGFRNTMEIKAYTCFEKKIKELSWSLENFAISISNEKAETEFTKCLSGSDLNLAEKRVIEEVENEIKIKADSCVQELEEYCLNHSNSGVASLWNEKKCEVVEKAVSLVKLKVQSELSNIKGEQIINLDTSDQSYHRDIVEKASQLAKGLQQGTLSEDQLKKEFDTLCDKEWKEFALQEKEDSIISVVDQVDNMLHQLYPGFQTALDKVLKATPLAHPLGPMDTLEQSFHLKCILQSDINITKDRGWFESEEKQFDKYATRAHGIIKSALRQIDLCLSTHKNERFRDSTHVSRILGIFASSISRHNEQKTAFNFSTDFIVRVAVHICRYAIPIFRVMEETYIANYGLVSKLSAKKESLWQLFICTAREKEQEDGVPRIIAHALEKTLIGHINNSVAREILKELLNTFKSKPFFIKEILVSLAQRENLELYLDYLSDSKAHALRWMAKYINKYYFRSGANRSSGRYFQIAEQEIQEACTFIKGLAKDTPLPVQTKSGSIMLKRWLEHFCAFSQGKKCLISINLFWHTSGINITNMNSFLGALCDGVDDLAESLSSLYRDFTPTTVNWGTLVLHEEVVEKVWGCSEQCPLCDEPCRHIDSDHVALGEPHRCIEHRPGALKGAFNITTVPRQLSSRTLVVWSCSGRVQSKSDTFPCSPLCSSNASCSRGEDEGNTHLSRDYAKYFSNWDIPPRTPTTTYWLWVFSRFRVEIADHYSCPVPGDFPPSWLRIKKPDALKSLQSVYDDM